jgi:hypothetical protein
MKGTGTNQWSRIRADIGAKLKKRLMSILSMLLPGSIADTFAEAPLRAGSSV